MVTALISNITAIASRIIIEHSIVEGAVLGLSQEELERMPHERKMNNGSFGQTP